MTDEDLAILVAEKNELVREKYRFPDGRCFFDLDDLLARSERRVRELEDGLIRVDGTLSRLWDLWGPSASHSEITRDVRETLVVVREVLRTRTEGE